MKYTVYNRTKNVRFEEFEYSEVLFTHHPLGQAIISLLDSEWKGDEIAIVPVSDANCELISLAPTAITKKYIESDDSYIEYNTGSIYRISPNKTIYRFNDLIPLISLNVPVELQEKYYTDINGKWAFKPLTISDAKPEKKNLSNMYDTENYFQNYSDDTINELIKDIDILEDSLWIEDIMSLLDN